MGQQDTAPGVALPAGVDAPGGAGLSTPTPSANVDIAAIAARLSAIEAENEKLRGINKELIEQRQRAKSRTQDAAPDGAPPAVDEGEKLTVREMLLADRAERAREKAAAERAATLSEMERAFDAAGGLARKRGYVRALEHVWSSKVRRGADGAPSLQEALHALRELDPDLFGAPPTSIGAERGGKAPTPTSIHNMRPGELTSLVKSDPKALDAVLAQMGHEPKKGMRL